MVNAFFQVTSSSLEFSLSSHLSMNNNNIPPNNNDIATTITFSKSESIKSFNKKPKTAAGKNAIASFK